MVNPFICGSGTFHHQLEEDDEPYSPCSTPRKPRKSNKDSKNPYAKRGLDKFSALLAELEDKRRKIYTQMGSHDISFVRFVYSDSDEDCKPVVVRVRDNKKQEKINVGNIEDKKPRMRNSEALDKDPIESLTSPKSKSDDSLNGKMDMWRPCYYLIAVIILILLFLAVFGRSFAIICTSVGWYFVPTIKGGSSNVKRSRKLKKKNNNNKEYARRASEKNIACDGLSSPKGGVNITGVKTDTSPRQHGHRKS